MNRVINNDKKRAKVQKLRLCVKKTEEKKERLSKSKNCKMG